MSEENKVPATDVSSEDTFIESATISVEKKEDRDKKKPRKFLVTDPVIIEFNPDFTALSEKEISEMELDIILPDGTVSQALEAIRGYADQYADKPDDKMTNNERRVGIALEQQNACRPKPGLMEDTLNDETAEWGQRVTVPTTGAGMCAMTSRVADNGVKVTGARALARVRSLTGRGGQMRIPMWHSGMWLTFNMPSEESIIQMFATMTSNKVNFGHLYYGGTLAYDTVLTNDIMLNFALEHLDTANIDGGNEKLLDMLDIRDIPNVAWGLACAIYQNGVNFARPIIVNDEGEVMDGSASRPIQIQSGKINPRKLQWVNQNALTDRQRTHMSKITQTITEESQKLYKADHVRGIPKDVQLSDELRVTFAPCSARRYIEAGKNWLNHLEAEVDKLADLPNKQARENALVNQSKASAMRMVDCWVSKISVKNGDDWEEFEADEEQTVELLLVEFTKDDEVRRKFFNAYRDYLNSVNITVIAVPLTPNEKEPNENWKGLYPIDPVSAFMTLLARRYHVISGREQN